MSLSQNKNFSGVQEGVFAFSDSKTGEIIAMTYEIQPFGYFVREDYSWRFITEEEMYNLSSSGRSVFDIERSKAMELVEKYDDATDEGRGLSESDLEGYLEGEGSG